MHASSAPDEPGRGIGPGVTWEPFGITPETWENVEERGGIKHLHLSTGFLGRPRGDSDRPPGSVLITAAAVLLGLLAAGLFVVSLAAQYRYVLAEKHQVAPAAIEAVGLDVGMAIFSLLALGLAMAGQSARIERALVIACALGSALMNYAAANGGSPRSVAAYVMPPIFLAIVVDRVVAVVRRHVLGETDQSAWAAFGRVALYGLRFALAAPSTATGLRRQVLNMTPLPAAAEVAAITALATDIDRCPDCLSTLSLDDGSCAGCGLPADPAQDDSVTRQRQPRDGSKTSRFLQLVEQQHGPLSAIDPGKVSRISSELAPLVDLHTGSARSVLGKRVRASQNGHSS